MSDIFGQVTEGQDPITKILSKVPGFKGYIERSERRASDQLLREVIAKRFEEQWRRLSGLQQDLISNQGIQFLDDIESAAVKIRQFIDRVKTASYGYSGLFDAVKINEKELAQLYEYDLNLLNMADEVGRAIDHVEATLGTPDGLDAVIRNLKTVAQQCVEVYNRRSEAIMKSPTGESNSQSSTI